MRPLKLLGLCLIIFLFSVGFVNAKVSVKIINNSQPHMIITKYTGIEKDTYIPLINKTQVCFAIKKTKLPTQVPEYINIKVGKTKQPVRAYKLKGDEKKGGGDKGGKFSINAINGFSKIPDKIKEKISDNIYCVRHYNFIKFGNHSIIVENQSDKSILFSVDNHTNITATLYWEVAGNWNNSVNNLFVYFNESKWKFGAINNGSENIEHYKYIIKSNGYIQKLRPNVFRVKTTDNWYKLDFTDICSEPYANCSYKLYKDYMNKTVFYEAFNPETNLTETFNYTKPVNQTYYLQLLFWSDNSIDPYFTILLKQAWELDENKSVIGDITEYVNKSDNDYYYVSVGNYVKIEYQHKLEHYNDISLIAKSLGSKVSVYDSAWHYLGNFSELITDRKLYKFYLTNLNHSENVFYLKVSNNMLGIDYITDPPSEYLYLGATYGLRYEERFDLINGGNIFNNSVGGSGGFVLWQNQARVTTLYDYSGYAYAQTDDNLNNIWTERFNHTPLFGRRVCDSCDVNQNTGEIYCLSKNGNIVYSSDNGDTWVWANFHVGESEGGDAIPQGRINDLDGYYYAIRTDYLYKYKYGESLVTVTDFNSEFGKRSFGVLDIDDNTGIIYTALENGTVIYYNVSSGVWGSLGCPFGSFTFDFNMESDGRFNFIKFNPYNNDLWFHNTGVDRFSCTLYKHNISGWHCMENLPYHLTSGTVNFINGDFYATMYDTHKIYKWNSSSDMPFYYATYSFDKPAIISYIAYPVITSISDPYKNITDITTSPSQVYTNTNINCSGRYITNSTETANITLAWYKNNNLIRSVDFLNISNSSIISDVLFNGNFTKGDTLKCVFELANQTFNSSEITVLNSAPTVTLISPALNTFQLCPVLFNVSVNDLDGDRVLPIIEILNKTLPTQWVNGSGYVSVSWNCSYDNSNRKIKFRVKLQEESNCTTAHKYSQINDYLNKTSEVSLNIGNTYGLIWRPNYNFTTQSVSRINLLFGSYETLFNLSDFKINISYGFFWLNKTIQNDSDFIINASEIVTLFNTSLSTKSLNFRTNSYIINYTQNKTIRHYISSDANLVLPSGLEINTDRYYGFYLTLLNTPHAVSLITTNHDPDATTNQIWNIYDTDSTPNYAWNDDIGMGDTGREFLAYINYNSSNNYAFNYLEEINWLPIWNFTLHRVKYYNEYPPTHKKAIGNNTWLNITIGVDNLSTGYNVTYYWQNGSKIGSKLALFSMPLSPQNRTVSLKVSNLSANSNYGWYVITRDLYHNCNFTSPMYYFSTSPAISVIEADKHYLPYHMLGFGNLLMTERLIFNNTDISAYSGKVTFKLADPIYLQNFLLLSSISVNYTGSRNNNSNEYVTILNYSPQNLYYTDYLFSLNRWHTHITTVNNNSITALAKDNFLLSVSSLYHNSTNLLFFTPNDPLTTNTGLVPLWYINTSQSITTNSTNFTYRLSSNTLIQRKRYNSLSIINSSYVSVNLSNISAGASEEYYVIRFVQNGITKTESYESANTLWWVDLNITNNLNTSFDTGDLFITASITESTDYSTVRLFKRAGNNLIEIYNHTIVLYDSNNNSKPDKVGFYNPDPLNATASLVYRLTLPYTNPSSPNGGSSNENNQEPTSNESLSDGNLTTGNQTFHMPAFSTGGGGSGIEYTNINIYHIGNATKVIPSEMTINIKPNQQMIKEFVVYNTLTEPINITISLDKELSDKEAIDWVYFESEDNHKYQSITLKLNGITSFGLSKSYVNFKISIPANVTYGNSYLLVYNIKDSSGNQIPFKIRLNIKQDKIREYINNIINSKIGFINGKILVISLFIIIILVGGFMVI